MSRSFTDVINEIGVIETGSNLIRNMLEQEEKIDKLSKFENKFRKVVNIRFDLCYSIHSGYPFHSEFCGEITIAQDIHFLFWKKAKSDKKSKTSALKSWDYIKKLTGSEVLRLRSTFDTT